MRNLSFKPSSIVRFEGRDWRVRKATDINSLWIEDVKTKAGREVDVEALLSQNRDEKAATPLHCLNDDDRAEARRRLELIEPILACDHGRMKLINDIATQNNVGQSTLRRWVLVYEGRRMLSDLAPARKGRKMPKRLTERMEKLIARVIESHYLKLQKRSVESTYGELVKQSKAMRLTPVHINTLRSRIAALPEALKVACRRGKKAARDQFGEIKGHYPNALYPLSIVQIDHTLLDIFILDDEERKPIGRVWLTLAIDVFSRMIFGYHLSLDPPSAFSVGMCIFHGANRKEEFLERLGLDTDWPVWSLPDCINADNGKDFRSHLIELACEEHGINLLWRPVKQPHFGGHIERLLGTIAKEIHALPGTTFSNIRELGEYDSEKSAAMTFEELDRWLVDFFVNVYHKREHKGLGVSPLVRWRQGILGDDKRLKGRGLPDLLPDPERLRLDLLPFRRITVTRDGLVWDKVHYNHDVLSPWRRARKAGKPVKFIVRRDPRDISKVHFLDPELKQYFEIPYRDLSKPSISAWEYAEADRHLKKQGNNRATEDEIFAARVRMDQSVENAKAKTKKTRRDQQRKKNRASSLAVEAAAVASATVQPGASYPMTGDRPVRLVVDNTQDEFFALPDVFDRVEDI